MIINKPKEYCIKEKIKYFDFFNTEFPLSELNYYREWYRCIFDHNGNIVLKEYYNGTWFKWEYDNKNRVLYSECNGEVRTVYVRDSDGSLVDIIKEYQNNETRI